MGTYRRKIPSAKNVRKRKRKKIVLRLMITFMIILIAVIGISLSPLCNISQVVVVGNKTIDSQKIIDSVGLPIGGNVFYSVEGSLFDKLFLNFLPYKESLSAKFVNIKSANFNFSLGGKISIKIIEREPFAYVKIGKGFALIDRDDVIMKVLSVRPSDGKVLILGLKFKQNKVSEKLELTSNEGVKKVQRLIDFFVEFKSGPQKMFQKVTAFDVTNPDNIAMDLEGGRRVLLGDIDNFSDPDLRYRFNFINSVFETGKAGQHGVLDYSSSSNPGWLPSN